MTFKNHIFGFIVLVFLLACEKNEEEEHQRNGDLLSQESTPLEDSIAPPPFETIILTGENTIIEDAFVSGRFGADTTLNESTYVSLFYDFFESIQDRYFIRFQGLDSIVEGKEIVSINLVLQELATCAIANTITDQAHSFVGDKGQTGENELAIQVIREDWHIDSVNFNNQPSEYVGFFEVSGADTLVNEIIVDMTRAATVFNQSGRNLDNGFMVYQSPRNLNNATNDNFIGYVYRSRCIATSEHPNVDMRPSLIIELKN